MPQMPKRVKFRKSQRGVARGRSTKERNNGPIRGFSHRGTGMPRLVSGEGGYSLGVSPKKPVTSIPAETRMGKGKGEPEYWAAVVRPGQILFEIAGLPENTARDCLARVAYKMPFKCRFVGRRANL